MKLQSMQKRYRLQWNFDHQHISIGFIWKFKSCRPGANEFHDTLNKSFWIHVIKQKSHKDS